MRLIPSHRNFESPHLYLQPTRFTAAMPSASFKGSQIRPPRYRTPTPPTEAVEPITPTFIGHAAILGVPALASDGFIKIVHPKENNTLNGIVKSRDERDTMNAFALIALATSPPAPSHQICQQASTSLANPTIGDAQVENHVSKRAKSEMLRSPGRQRAAQETGPRPATSYNAQNHSLKSDAELLLNFSQVARSGHTVHHFHRHTKSDQTSIVSSSPLKPADVTTSHQTLNGLRIDKTQGYAAQYSSFATIPRKSDENRSVKARAEEGERCSTGQGVLENTFDHTAGLPRTDARLMHCDPSPDDVRSSGSQRTSISWARGSPPPFQENTRDTESTRSPKVDDKMEPEPTPEPSSKKSMDGQHQRTVMSTSQRTLSPRPKLKSKAHEAQYLPHEMKDSSQTISGPDKIGPSRQELPSKYSASAASICGACHFNKNSSSMDNEYNATSWISCDACKSWFHFACAGFRSEREVRGVDKFRCKKCKPIHGATTFVRKSSRAHTAIDYAGLNEGVIKTSDEQPEHHYIKPIKDGIITFLPDTFARMPPELVTAEFFERSYGMKEPIVIPAVLNPRPQSLDIAMTASFLSKTADLSDNATSDNIPSEDFSFSDGGYEAVPEHEQDALDMVIPRNLTVRQVAELYGPEEKVEVIDVKSQNGESKKWNMRRWADYYESSGNKVVRNVISLEVSQSKLGRLIRRPQIVRDLDLQDSVWPAELRLKGEVPRVQFYCLMSVADCFTDFHIDFGGSSVFYHILRGKKTFLFIPPKEKHLKKYEEWCMSPAQNWTFLADQTKECYRVDLSEGDTMLIPAGWIHAVWTPEDSLVIGGNFLTRMNYGMQLKIAQLEKATGVARKFRYPHFQKLHWYAALKYLEDDPVPRSVKDLLQVGETFHRERPAHHDFDNWGDNSEPGCEKYHARYYSQSELEGLPELTRYLLRTTLIDNGSISDGITQETRNAVRKSIPRGHGEPLELVKAFALWCAWKRGNEELPSWAYPGAAPDVPDASEKLSAAAQKRMEKEAALQAPRRQSTRKQRQEQIAALVTPIAQETSLSMDQKSELGGLVSSKVPSPRPSPPVRRKASAFSEDGLDRTDVERSAKKQRTLSGPSPSSRRKIACETCRQRRRACKHKVIISVSNTSDEVLVPTVGTQEEPDGNGEESAISINPMDFRHHLSQADLAVYGSAAASREPFSDPFQSEETQTEEMIQTARLDLSLRQAKSETLIAPDDPQHPSLDTVQHLPENTDWQSRIVDVHQMDHDVSPSEVNVHHIRARTKACADCRKSKVLIDPILFTTCHLRYVLIVILQ